MPAAEKESRNLVSLLFCSDDLLRSVMCEAMEKCSIRPYVFSDPAGAQHAVHSAVLDALMVDWDEETAGTLLEQARTSVVNARAFSVAVVRHASMIKACFASGASYAIHRPETRSQALAALKPVSAMLLRDRRAGTRYVINVPASLHLGDERETCAVDDISATGASLSVSHRINRHEIVSIVFRLPNRHRPFHASAKVMWSTNSQCGLRFFMLEPADRQALDEWLAARQPRQGFTSITTRSRT